MSEKKVNTSEPELRLSRLPAGPQGDRACIVKIVKALLQLISDEDVSRIYDRGVRLAMRAATQRRLPGGVE